MASIVHMLSSSHLNVPPINEDLPPTDMMPQPPAVKQVALPAPAPARAPAQPKAAPKSSPKEMDVRSDFSLFASLHNDFAEASPNVTPPEPAPTPKQALPEVTVRAAPASKAAPAKQAKAVHDLRPDWQLSHQLSTEFSAGALSVDSEVSASFSARRSATKEEEPATAPQPVMVTALPPKVPVRPPATASKVVTQSQPLMPAPWSGLSNELGLAFPGHASPSPPARRSRNSSRATAEESFTNKENDEAMGGEASVTIGKFNYGPARPSTAAA